MYLAIASIVGAILIQFSLGSFSSSGNMNPYLASYMERQVNSAIGHAELQWVGAASLVSFGFFNVLAGIMEESLGTKLTCLTGSIILSYGLLVSYSTVQTSFGLLVLTDGITIGLGTALAYSPSIFAPMQWFPSKQGLVSGMVLAAYYMGFLGSTLLQTMYLNPNQESTDEHGYFDDPMLLQRVPTLFLWMSAISSTLQAVGVALINRPAPDYIDCYYPYQEIGETTRLLDGPLSSILPSEVEDHSPWDMVSSPLFRTIWITCFLNSIVTVSMVTSYKNFGETIITDDTFLTYIGCLGAATNAIGSIFWGLVVDNTSYKTSMIAITVMLTVTVATMGAVPHLGSAAYVFWGMTLFFATAGNTSLMPTIIKKTFGHTHATTNVGVLFTAQGCAAFLVAFGVQELLKRINYSGFYVIEACFTAIAFILTLRLPDGL